MFYIEPASPHRGGPSYHEVAPGSDDRLSEIKVSVVGQEFDKHKSSITPTYEQASTIPLLFD
jgi:hypothetical protein